QEAEDSRRDRIRRAETVQEEQKDQAIVVLEWFCWKEQHSHGRRQLDRQSGQLKSYDCWSRGLSFGWAWLFRPCLLEPESTKLVVGWCAARRFQVVDCPADSLVGSSWLISLRDVGMASSE